MLCQACSGVTDCTNTSLIDSFGICPHMTEDNKDLIQGKDLLVAYYDVDYEKNAKGSNYWRNRWEWWGVNQPGTVPALLRFCSSGDSPLKSCVIAFGSPVLRNLDHTYRLPHLLWCAVLPFMPETLGSHGWRMETHSTSLSHHRHKFPGQLLRIIHTGLGSEEPRCATEFLV